MNKYKTTGKQTLFDAENSARKLSEIGNPLEKLDSVIDFEMFRSRLEASMVNHGTKSKAGAKQYDVVMMFKVMVLRQYYNLSYEQTEYQIIDRSSFKQFLGLASGDKVPDANTIRNFFEGLKEKGLGERLFQDFVDGLLAKGFIFNEGQIVDASFVLAPRQHNTREENKKMKKILVVGDNATRIMAQGGVGAGVKTLYEVTPLAGLEKALKGKAKITYVKGYEPMPRRKWGETKEPDLTEWNNNVGVLRAEAVSAAKAADMVIFVGGDNREVESEGSDRKDIDLPFYQNELLEAMAAVNPKIVTVMVAGAPVDLRRADKLSGSLVYSWFNGSEGGNALADVLTGKIAPSGKLPFTLPVKLDDSPAYALGVYPQKAEQQQADVFVGLVDNGQNSKGKMEQKADADYSEGIMVGYRWFLNKDVKPMYPFGHGLSYVPFRYADAKAEVKGDNIEVTFDITNQGRMAADEVAQVYVGRPDSKVERPKYELKGFKRVPLKGNETTTVTITIPIEQLRHWNEFQHAWNIEKGKATIYIGTSSVDLPLQAEVEI